MLLASILSLTLGLGAPAEAGTLSAQLRIDTGLSAADAAALVRAQPGTHALLHGLQIQGIGQVVLEVERFEALRADAAIVSGAGGVARMDMLSEARAVSCWRGAIQGDMHSHAFIAVSPRGLTGWIEQDGRRYALVPADPQARGLVAGVGGADGRPAAPLHVVESKGSASPLGQEMCRMLSHGSDKGGASGSFAQVPWRRRALDLAVETDHELWQLFQSDAVATQYIVALWGAISDIYVRDHDIGIRISYLRLWPTADDGYEDADPLYQFRDRWNSLMGGVDRDAATLMTGRRNLPYGGVAWLNALCSDYGYSVTGYIIGTFADPVGPDHGSWDINVCAHELGHNCGTLHTHDYGLDTCNTGTPQRGEIMSYCHVTSGGSANIDLRFTTYTQGEVRGFVQASATCLAQDCNLNGIDDAVEIAGGLVADTNGDGIPDSVQDCNHDGVLDPLEIALGAPDQNGNGVPDGCEPDCNGNGIVDEADIALATSEDLQLDGVPDECERDCNSDSRSDYAELQQNPALDLDRDARLDSCQDCDGDGILDFDAVGRALGMWVGSSGDGALRELHGESGVRMRSLAGAQGQGVTALRDVIITGSRVLAAGGNGVYGWNRLTGAYAGALVVDAGFSGARALCLLPDGRLAVAWSTPPTIRTYDAATGAALGTLVGNGTGLTDPRDLIVTARGTLLASCGNDRIREYQLPGGQSNGVLVSAAAGIDFAGMLELADGRLLACSRGQDAILAYDAATGAALGRFDVGPVSTASTALVNPDGLALTDDGRTVLVASNGSNASIGGYQVSTGYYTRAYRIYAVDAPAPTAIAVAPPAANDVNRDLVPDSCQHVGDLNGDGAVDGADLGLLLGSFGLTGGLADLNADGLVDGADLGLLLGGWTG